MAKRSQKTKGGTGPKAPPDLDDLPFEKALAELEQIVDTLEEGTLSLEESLARFERGIHLSRHLEAQLRSAEQRVRQLVGEAGDDEALAPLDAASGEDDAGGGEDSEDEEGDGNGDPRLPF